MSTISEKLIQLKNMKQDIKDAINSGGGNVGDDFSTYAGEVNKITSYENPDFYELRTQGGTNFDFLFRSYNGPVIDVSQWDTSRVTSAKYCFADCTKSFDISNWDLSSLTGVSYMFSSSNTDYIDVRNIKLPSATSYSYMFNSCAGTELDLSSWDISNVTSLISTFYQSNFKKINLTGWKTTNVTNFDSTFNMYNSKLTHLIIPDWDMTNATNTSSFINTSYFKCKYIDLSRSNDVTITKIAPFLPTYTATTFGDILVPADTSQDIVDALIAKYWKPIGPKFDLVSTEPVFELDEIKPGKTTKVWTGNNNPWYGADGLEYIEFISSDESIATVDGREITGVSEGTVEISARNKETQETISTAPITLTVSETDNYPNLIKFRTDGKEGTNNILTVNGTKVKASNCTYDSIANIYSYDPGKQITSITFCGNSSAYAYITDIIKFNFNAANITDMGMFYGYNGILPDLSDWDISNVISVNTLFAECKYKTIDISGLDTSNVTNFSNMFTSCSNLVTIIGELDMSNSTHTTNFYSCDVYGHPFRNCYNLETVYLKNIYKNCTMRNSNDWAIDLSITKIKDECLLYIINELPNLYDKGITNNTLIILTLPKTNTLTESDVQVAISKGWICANCNF